MIGSDVAYSDDGTLRYGRVQGVSKDGLIVVSSDEYADPVHLPPPHPALPDMIVASARFDGSSDWVGINVTDEILAMSLDQVAALRDVGPMHRPSLPPALAAKLFAVREVEMVGAISAFFGRLPSAAVDGPRMAREIDLEAFQARRQLHYGLMQSAPAPSM